MNSKIIMEGEKKAKSKLHSYHLTPNKTNTNAF